MAKSAKEAEELLGLVYRILAQKRTELSRALSGFDLKWGYYDGNYTRAEDGRFVRQDYPIPVITVDRCCDIEIGLERIGVSAKLSREKALSCTFEMLAPYDFEAYGAEDFLADCYHKGMSIAQMKQLIGQSTETEIEFSFSFAFDAETEQLCQLVQLLVREGFYQ